MHLYTKIEKSYTEPDDTLIVTGVVTSEAVDGDGEIISADAMRKALPDYLRYGCIREQHSAQRAVGTTLSLEVGDDGKTRIRAKIVDRDTISKIKHGVLKGFSIGGSIVKRIGKKIVEILLTEISLVDRPSNPESVFSFGKAYTSHDASQDNSPVNPASLQQLTEDEYMQLSPKQKSDYRYRRATFGRAKLDAFFNAQPKRL